MTDSTIELIRAIVEIGILPCFCAMVLILIWIWTNKMMKRLDKQEARIDDKLKRQHVYTEVEEQHSQKVGDAINKYISKYNPGVLLITHYKRLLDYINPTHVHIVENGKIVETGDFSLVDKIEKEGFKITKEKKGILWFKIMMNFTCSRIRIIFISHLL